MMPALAINSSMGLFTKLAPYKLSPIRKPAILSKSHQQLQVYIFTCQHLENQLDTGEI
jgi:hypothetical protein